MDANRFFSVPFDNRNDMKILRMRRRLGGIVAYGRWVALLGMLYDEGGVLDMTDQDVRDVVADELELDDVDEFFSGLVKVGLIEKEFYETMGHVINDGVCREIEYRRKKSEAGKKGNDKRWGRGGKQ